MSSLNRVAVILKNLLDMAVKDVRLQIPKVITRENLEEQVIIKSQVAAAQKTAVEKITALPTALERSLTTNAVIAQLAKANWANYSRLLLFGVVRKT